MPITLKRSLAYQALNYEGVYNKVWAWVLTYGPRIIISILVFIIGEWFIKVIKRKLKRRFDRLETHISLRPFLEGVIAITLQVLLVLLIMQILGIQLTIFAAVIAAFGAAAGFALSGTLQNFASGILILLLKPFVVGDNIKAQDQEGTVTSIQLFYTIITTFDNRTVVMPNSKLSNEMIVNITMQGRRRLDIELKFNYGVDYELVKQTIIKHVAASNDILSDPKARIGISAFDPDGYKMMVNIWLNAHRFEDTRLSVQEGLLAALKQSGIKLPGM